MLQSVSTPASLAEAQAMLATGDKARIIAGGTVVMPELNYGTDAFTSLVSLRRVGLSGISVADGRAAIGAATTLAEIEDDPRLAFLHSALDAIASPTIRNMATVGGNLFVRQPYGDFAVCLTALDATARVSGPGGERDMGVDEILRRGIGPGDIVTSVGFALPVEGSFRFAKAGRKALNAAAIITVAAIVTVKGGTVADCRIALGGVAPRCVRALSTEAALKGKPFDQSHVEAAAKTADKDIDPADDAYASAWYRRRVTPVHIRRALLGE